MDENKSELNTTAEEPTSYGTSSGLFGETDRDSGEYHFRSGYTHQVYSNAHYMKADDSMSPPKYFRPTEADTVPSAQTAVRKKSSSGFILVLVLCFLCALIGGSVSGILTYSYLTGDRGTELISNLFGTSDRSVMSSTPAAEEWESTDNSVNDAAVMEPTPVPEMSAAEIYQNACSQVVSIGTDIVNIDRFGNQIPAVISGSGFIVSGDGYIVTNYHVVEHAVNSGSNVNVTMFDGSLFKGAVVGYDLKNDLAVVKIDKDGLTPALLGDSDTVKVGNTVYAVGNPYGVLEFTMTVGHVSAKNRLIATDNDEENSLNMFQIDAAVYSGNSGGPAYDAYGKVIGIVSARYSEEGMEGIGFAIPINDALPIINELLDKGYVSGRASIDASFDENYNTVLSRYYRLPEGAYINSVSHGGAAENAGLRSGDIIMKIGEYRIDSYADIPAALNHFNSGEIVEVVIFREGTLYSAKVKLGEAVPDAYQDEVVVYLDGYST